MQIDFINNDEIISYENNAKFHTKQQCRILNGQIIVRDKKAAMKGLNRLLKKAYK